MPMTKLEEFLNRNGVPHQVIPHPVAFTATSTAGAAHIPGKEMAKTVVVTVRRRASHAEYGKIQTLRVKYKAHAEDHDPKKPTINEGDKVLIAETRPLSATKRWRLVKILEKAQ